MVLAMLVRKLSKMIGAGLSNLSVGYIIQKLDFLSQVERILLETIGR